MNTKILELAQEATRKYDRLGYEIPFAQPDLEDFATLMIEECCKVMYERDSFYGEWMGGIIKKHFGID